jgi:hypothetical protein
MNNAPEVFERSRVAAETKLDDESSAAADVVEDARVVALDKVAADAAIEEKKRDEYRCKAFVFQGKQD